MKKIFFAFLIAIGSGTAFAQSFKLIAPAGSTAFGTAVTVLTNGNYVVTDPSWTTGGLANVGAVYLYNGQTNTLISTLTGSQANDYVGNNGVTAMSNGNYVVRSPNWKNGSATNAGAVTWCSGSAGVAGAVSASNSLVGSTTNDYVGNYGVTALSNGNYVVRSSNWKNGSATNAGAVTWCSGSAGVAGVVSASNSLVGSQANDNVGNSGVTALSNGNYVVSSSSWSNGSATYAGAVTWCSGSAGVAGVVSASNSLVGSTTYDYVGNYGVTALSNGNYVVRSSNWSNGSATYAGAVTWGSGSAGVTGAVSTSNSLVGSKTYDHVGNSGVTALSNGNYVVSSGSWSNGSATYAGAVTWCSGSAGVAGVVSASNSLVGSTTYDYVGNYGVTALSNGNYVVSSGSWSNGSATSAGAVTWCSGSAGVTGAVSTSNSLVGSRANDNVGSYGITALSNGNYVVSSGNWNNGSATSTGAVTLGNAGGTTIGPVSSCNSVVGNVAGNGYYMNQSYNYTYEKLIVGKRNENLVAVFSPVQTALAGATSTATNTASGTATVAFADNACTLVASLKPSGATPVSGPIDANVYVQTTTPTTAGGTAYVRRHYDITPATGANTATATVVLYFTQDDFDNYNANNGAAADLPTGPADATGIAALRVTQQHGTSATGTIGSYTGWAGTGASNVLITPDPSNVVWNSNVSRWEVGFDVTGFSGFFVSGGNIAPLPVKLLGFSAKAESSRNRLDWNTATETASCTFEVMRSADGSAFEKVGELAGKATPASYLFYDALPLEGNNYYRLNIAEPSGEKSFSKVVLVKRSSLSGGLTVSPIPATNTITLTNSNGALAGSTVTALNMQSQVMATFVLESSTKLDVQNWPAGIYMLKFADGSVLKVVKQ